MQECFFSSRRLSSGKCIYGAKPRSRFYDAENRLTSCETTSAAVAAGVPKQRLEFAYDYMGRRIQKVVKAWNTTTSTYQVSSDTRFLYDGWNLIAEFNGLASNAVVRTYVWGTDLSGSLQGAGGVGGLLAVNTASATYFPTFDGNGNVTGLVNAADGSLAAEFEFDPFGNVIKAVGAAANAQPFGFSTKYTDTETNLVYYGMRWYSPNVGRFFSRDPIGELGGSNIYGFVGNDPISWYDYLGRDRDSQTRQDLNRADFEKALAESLKRTLTPEEQKQIDRGCIGVAAAFCYDRKSRSFPNLPERASGVKCFKTEPEAEASKCADCEKKVVFAKQATWKDGEDPDPLKYGDPGEIDPYSMGSNPDGTFNYITKFNGSYIWMNHAAKYGNQIGTISPYPANDPHYPNTMWCRRCTKDLK